MAISGYSGSANSSTEKFNGTAWSAGGTLALGRYYVDGCGTAPNALCIGGINGSSRSEVEKYA